MKKILISILFLSTAGLLSAQQTINSNNPGDFHSLSISGNINVELIEADINSIEVQLYESDINKFKWGVNNGVLSASLRPTVGKKSRADIRIYYKDEIKSVSIMDAKLSTKAPLVSCIFKLSVSGGGSANMAVDTQDLEIDVTGNSSVVISGDTKYLTVRGTERSKVDTRTIHAMAVDVEAVTGAEVYIYASERLVAKARNASTIYYAGNPKIFKDNSASTSIGSSVLNIGHKE